MPRPIHKLKPIPVPIEPKPISSLDNPWYPLPPDYPQLTEEGQRAARVNAASLRSTPEEEVVSWTFFCKTYLEPTPPGFFYKRYKPSPPAHYEWIRDIARYPLVLHGAPRGSAKTTALTRSYVLKTALTQPYLTWLIVPSKQSIIRYLFSSYLQQFGENEFIARDFGLIRPSKAAGKQWSMDGAITLSNGSDIYGFPVDARKRGARPDKIILDDPEYDPSSPGRETILRQHLEVLLFHQLLPMFDDLNAPFIVMEWIGTMINRRSALWTAATGEDPRFQKWTRRIYAAETTNRETDEVTYFWPQKWDRPTLDNIQETIGRAAYQAEYLNNPVSEGLRAFHLTEEFDTYTIAGDEISYIKSEHEPVRVTLKHDEWLSGLARIITVDLAHTVSATSDFSGALVVGIDAKDVWWVLDLYLARVLGIALIEKTWDLGIKWQPTLIGVETAAGQQSFMEWLDTYVQTHPGYTGWLPRGVWPIKYPSRMSKEERIMTLEPRSAAHRIRFPKHLLKKWPVAELWNQMSNFTSDGLSLSHDDALDMLAMVRYCPKITPSGVVDTRHLVRDAYSLLEAGELIDPTTNLPVMLGLDISKIPWDVLEKCLDKRHGVEDNRREQGSPSSLGIPYTRRPQL